MARGQLGRAGESTGKLIGAIISLFFPAFGAVTGGGLGGAGGAGGAYGGGSGVGADYSSIGGSYLDDGAIDSRTSRDERARNQALIEQLEAMLTSGQGG